MPDEFDATLLGCDPDEVNVGDMMEVLRDDGAKDRRVVQIRPWRLGHGAWLVGLSGISGGYALSRCRRIPGPEEASYRETQESIYAWMTETFPGMDPNSPRKAIRALEEMVELCLAAGATPTDIHRAVLKGIGDRPDHATYRDPGGIPTPPTS